MIVLLPSIATRLHVPVCCTAYVCRLCLATDQHSYMAIVSRRKSDQPSMQHTQGMSVIATCSTYITNYSVSIANC